MNTPYAYRFKTEEEFIDTLGQDWRRFACFNDEGRMDFLCGTIFPFHNITEGCTIMHKGWAIDKIMLTENEKCKPNYKPRKVDKLLDWDD